METFESLQDALGPPLGLLLLSAWALELYNLVYNLLPWEPPAHRSSYTGVLVYSVYQRLNKITTLKNMVIEVFRDFVSVLHGLLKYSYTKQVLCLLGFGTLLHTMEPAVTCDHKVSRPFARAQ